MRYSTKNYAQALASAIAQVRPEEKSHVAKNFMGLLRKSGDEVHAMKIIKEASRLLLLENGGRDIVFESARPLTKSHAKIVQEFAKNDDAVTMRINEELIAGIRVIMNGEREFDGSLKGKLDNIFSE